MPRKPRVVGVCPVCGKEFKTTNLFLRHISSRKCSKKKHPSVQLPAGVKTKKRKPINIRGDIYKHYASCSGMGAAGIEKKRLQDQGFKVLVRKYGPRRIHVYKGPKKKRR